MAASTHDRILTQAAQLLSAQGYAATGMQQIVAASQAPFGSIYHHFPGGKIEIAAAAIRTAGAAYVVVLPAAFDGHRDLESGVRAFFGMAAEHLEESGYADGCPIATVALEVASTNELLRQATADVFDGWLEYGTAYFRGWGVNQNLGRSLTLALVTALEGAFVLARATRRTESLRLAADLVSGWLRENDHAMVAVERSI